MVSYPWLSPVVSPPWLAPATGGAASLGVHSLSAQRHSSQPTCCPGPHPGGPPPPPPPQPSPSPSPPHREVVERLRRIACTVKQQQRASTPPGPTAQALRTPSGGAVAGAARKGSTRGCAAPRAPLAGPYACPGWTGNPQGAEWGVCGRAALLCLLWDCTAPCLHPIFLHLHHMFNYWGVDDLSEHSSACRQSCCERSLLLLLLLLCCEGADCTPVRVHMISRQPAGAGGGGEEQQPGKHAQRA